MSQEESQESQLVVVDDFFVDWTSHSPIVQFPYHVQEILYELTLNYLLHRPNDAVSFCLDFLKQLRSAKKVKLVYDFVPEKRPPEVAGLRRNSVFAKVFDPREDANLPEPNYPKTEEEKERLKATLQNLLFFRNLDKDDFERVMNAMFMKLVSKGEVVIRQGDDGDFFYVVHTGTYNAFRTKDDQVTDLCHYANSGYFGELALLYNQPRAATVVALTDGLLWALDRDTFQRIVLSSSFHRSRRYETMIETVPILMTLGPMERIKVADALVPKEYADGEEIIRQGDPADGMYFLESGTVSVLRRERSHQNVVVNRLKPGEYFGELALLTLKPRACSVVAQGRVKVAFLDVTAFERLLGPCINLMKRNILVYEQQLREVLGPQHNISDLRPS